MTHIKAIVFDFDGLILDTETTDFEAWQAMYRAYGVELPLSMWLPIIGDATQDFKIDQHLVELTGKPIDRDELRQRQKALHIEMLEDATPNAGSRRLHPHRKTTGYPNRSRLRLQSILGRKQARTPRAS